MKITTTVRSIFSNERDNSKIDYHSRFVETKFKNYSFNLTKQILINSNTLSNESRKIFSVLSLYKKKRERERNTGRNFRTRINSSSFTRHSIAEIERTFVHVSFFPVFEIKYGWPLRYRYLLVACILLSTAQRTKLGINLFNVTGVSRLT